MHGCLPEEIEVFNCMPKNSTCLYGSTTDLNTDIPTSLFPPKPSFFMCGAKSYVSRTPIRRVNGVPDAIPLLGTFTTGTPVSISPFTTL